MKLYCTTLLSLVLSTALFGQNHRKYIESGLCGKVIEEEGTITNGKKEGYWKYYYACLLRQDVRTEGRYENDKKVGLWKSHSPHGFMYQVVSYVNGEANGEYTGYHQSGAVQYKGTYRNGKLVDVRTEYYENGKVKVTENFQTGEIKTHHYNGTLERMGYYDLNEWLHKKGEWKYWYDNGTLQAVGHYDGLSVDKKKGIWKEYHRNGKLSATGEMKEYSRIGKWELYHDNGQLQAEGVYSVDGYPKPGTWLTYNREGVKDGINIPPPTRDQIVSLFLSVDQRQEYTGLAKFAFSYQDILWKMAGADPNEYQSLLAKGNDSVSGYLLVGRMWNTYAPLFVEDGYINNSASGKNIMKFAIAGGNTTVLREGMRRYKFSYNFIDPADGKTLMDYLAERIKSKAAEIPVYEDGLTELKQLYDRLKAYGAKHANEL